MSHAYDYSLFTEPLFDVGGKSKVIVPKSQLIFGEPGNETTFFVQTEVNFSPLF
jgi:hypothetical protein